MRVAFDLDGTLIDHRFLSEIIPKPCWKIFHPKEKLRKGIREAADYLQQVNIEIWIYTSSFRSLFYIKMLFRKYGIHLDGIINQEIHNKALKKEKRQNYPSKFPLYWDIDLLVEDQAGVRMEGEQFGFEVLLLDPEDEGWVRSLKEKVDKMRLDKR